ncbi:MAG: hypothetical protein LBU74_07590 [Methanobacteriaceae archaeon]|nr:hypothetical protein [Candidatus Methanorudis spinitermitis]
MGPNQSSNVNAPVKTTTAAPTQQIAMMPTIIKIVFVDDFFSLIGCVGCASGIG